jgi:hypothetical protein
MYGSTKKIGKPNGSTFKHGFPFLEPLCSIWNQSKQQQNRSRATLFHHTPEGGTKRYLRETPIKVTPTTPNILVLNFLIAGEESLLI